MVGNTMAIFMIGELEKIMLQISCTKLFKIKPNFLFNIVKKTEKFNFCEQKKDKNIIA